MGSCAPSHSQQVLINNEAFKYPYKKGDVVYLKPDSSVALITGYTGKVIYLPGTEDSISFSYSVSDSKNNTGEIDPEFIYGLKHQNKPESPLEPTYDY